MLLLSCERIFILRNELSEKVNISFNRNSLEKLKSKSDQEINNGNYRLAIETNIMIRDLLKEMKDSSESVIFTTREISDLYLKTGQITKAENELTIALKENPNNYYLLYGILNVLLDKKDYSALIYLLNFLCIVGTIGFCQSNAYTISRQVGHNVDKLPPLYVCKTFGYVHIYSTR